MRKIVTLLVVLLVVTQGYAVPARPRWQTKSQPDGTSIEVQLVGDEFHHYWMNREGQRMQVDGNGYWQVVGDKAIEQRGDEAIGQRGDEEIGQRGDKAMRRLGVKAKAPAVGSPKGLVILVNFQDESFQAVNTQSAMHDMMNGDSYTYDDATGSIRQYFSDQSNGLYTPEFDVVGPVTLPYDMSHYGENDSEDNDLLAGDMIVEACSIANELYEVDFTLYDNDEDDYVDFVYVIYAGLGEADGGQAKTIWPHAWELESSEYFNKCTYSSDQRIFDGKSVNSYACSGELSGITDDEVVVDKMRTGIGTIAHEFSHVIGLHDLYDTDYGQNHINKMTPGAWHIMDDGSYNNNGKTPPGYTIYDKYYLGWITPENPGSEGQVLTMAAGEGYQIASSDTLVSATNTHTVYYIENRQLEGWDAHLPGHGLLIWKLMYNPFVWDNNGANDTNGTIRYALVSATGQTTNIGTAADAFPGTGHQTIWTGLRGRALTSISEDNGVITLDYVANTGDGPIGPEEIYVEDMHYANAFYYSSEDVGYYMFDVHKDVDMTTGEMIYPEVTFTVIAKSKTAINGTYDILYGDYWRSAADMVDVDAAQPACVTIQHVNSEGDYSVKGSFTGTDGIIYIFNSVVHVSAKDCDNEYLDITFDESGEQTGVDNTLSGSSTTYKILRNGQLLIISHENAYSIEGRKVGATL